jgi:YhgE/Pip-like protein
MQALLSRPLTWAFVVSAGLMGAVTALSYLGGFIDPMGNMRDMPLAVANEDRGITVNGATVNLGDQLVQTLIGPDRPLGTAFKWTVLSSREEVLAGLAKDKYYAALVIPADYSQRLVAMSSPTALESAPPAQLEALTNPASGSIAGTEAQAAVLGVVTQTSKKVQDQALAAARAANASLSPAAVAVLSDPVRATLTVAQPVGSRSARGLAPFYFAVVITIAGFIGANVIDRGALLVTGREEFDVLHLTLASPLASLSRRSQWLFRFILVIPMSVLVAALVTVTAVPVLGMDTPNAWTLGGFALLGVLASALVTLFFITALGTPGVLAGVLFTTILGVPSAGGVYPPEMLPGFFQFLGAWLPLHYMTDGTRALMFFDGRGSAGLNAAIGVLLGYVAISAQAGWTTATLVDRARRMRGAQAGTALPSPSIPRQAP